jgi:hypothetical protein
MNERIRELKQQARDFYLLQEDLDCSITELHELVEEKFAELLIRECADIALRKGMASPDTDFRTGSILLSEYLLVRFGVEE